MERDPLWLEVLGCVVVGVVFGAMLALAI